MIPGMHEDAAERFADALGGDSETIEVPPPRLVSD
jgi:hypothetical protein